MSTLLTRPTPLATAPSAGPRRRRAIIAPLGIGMFAFLVSVAGNWIPSLWNDEVATVTSATRTWAQLFAEVQHVDAVHAAYYSFMHVVFDLVGYSPFTLRLPSALAIGGAAALLVVLVRMIVDTRLAVTSGLIFAVLPRVAWAGGEGRSYAISALLAITLTLLLVLALRRGRARWWVLYGAAIVVACTVFIYLALIVLAHGVTVFALRHRALSPAAALGPRRHPLRRWIITVAAVGVASLPFAHLVMSEGGQVSWIPAVDATTFHSVLLTQWFWKSPGLAAIAWTLVAAAVVILVMRRRRDILASVILPAVFLPTAALIIVSVLYEPLYSPRYLTMCTPFVAIAMAVPISLLRARWQQVAALLLICSFAVPNLIAERAPEAKQGSSWTYVASLIAAQRAAAGPNVTTGILYGPLRHHFAATTREIEYAYPEAFAGTVDITLSKPAGARPDLWETHHSLTNDIPMVQSTDVVYLITSVKQDRRPSTAATLSTIGWYAIAEWHFRSVNVVEYTFTGLAPIGPLPHP